VAEGPALREAEEGARPPSVRTLGWRVSGQYPGQGLHAAELQVHALVLLSAAEGEETSVSAPAKKRSWQSLAKENDLLKGILDHVLSHCPKCDGSRKIITKDDKVYPCGFCGHAWSRYSDATGERQ
jgi:hypothetical protein